MSQALSFFWDVNLGTACRREEQAVKKQRDLDDKQLQKWST